MVVNLLNLVLLTVTDVEDGDIKYAGNTRRRFDASLSNAIGPDCEYGVVIVRINDGIEIK